VARRNGPLDHTTSAECRYQSCRATWLRCAMCRRVEPADPVGEVNQTDSRNGSYWRFSLAKFAASGCRLSTLRGHCQSSIPHRAIFGLIDEALPVKSTSFSAGSDSSTIALKGPTGYSVRVLIERT